MEVKTSHIACGTKHSLFISDSGKAYGTGEGLDGEVGNEREQVCPSPVFVNDGVDNDGADSAAKRNYYQVACGQSHSIAITDDGFCYTWGKDSHGCLGHGKNSSSYRTPLGTKRSNTIPMLVRYLLGLDYVVNLRKDVRSPSRDPVAIKYVAAGTDYSAAVDETGHVFVWGKNDFGNLGLGDNEGRMFPALVNKLAEKEQTIVKVACGPKHMVAISYEGTLWSWGHGESGKLGLGHTFNMFEPAIVTKLERVYMTDASCGESHTAVVDDSGKLYTWGKGAFGRLGHSDEVTLFEPKQVISLNVPCSHSGNRVPFISDVACGAMHTLALTRAGRLYSFGGGMYGKLGLGDFDNRFEPTAVIHLQHEVVTQVATGMFHSMVLTQSGTIYGFGFGGTMNSRLGLGDVIEADSTIRSPEKTIFAIPTKLTSFPAVARQIVRSAEEIGEKDYILTFTGTKEYEAVKEVASMLDMGTDDLSALDISMLEASLSARTVIGVAAGRHHTLFVTYGGAIYSFGENQNGQLGLGHLDDQLTPKRISLGIGQHRMKSVFCGARHSMSITARGVAYAWGECEHGQLGTGRLLGSENQPVRLESAKSWRVQSISCGEEHSGAITADGAVLMWGINDLGQLGIATAGQAIPTPVQIVGELREKHACRLSLGVYHSCCVTEEGSLYTWGNGWYGKLGHGSDKSFLIPTLIDYLSQKRIKDVSCGPYHTLALTDEGLVYSFGKGDSRLGHGLVFDNITEPKMISSLWIQDIRAHKICAAENHSIIITDDGCVYSWGNGVYGKLGNASKIEVENQTFQDVNEAQLVTISDGTRLELGRNLTQRAMPDLRDISSVGNHTIAISMIGTVYTWGNGGSGRLGFNNTDTVPFPTVLNLARLQTNSGKITEVKNSAIVSKGDTENKSYIRDNTSEGIYETNQSSSKQHESSKGIKVAGMLPVDFTSDLQRMVHDLTLNRKLPTFYQLYRLLAREPSCIELGYLTTLQEATSKLSGTIAIKIDESRKLGEQCTGLQNDIQVMITSTLGKMYPNFVGVSRANKRKAKQKQKVMKTMHVANESQIQRHKVKSKVNTNALYGKGEISKTILLRLGAYSQIIGILLAHPCYLIHLHDRVFFDFNKRSADGTDNSETSKEAHGLEFEMKDHKQLFFSLVSMIYNDISHPRHVHLFLLFTLNVLTKEVTNTFSAGNIPKYFDLLQQFLKSDSSIGFRCMKHVFRKNATAATNLKTHFSKAMVYLANMNESIDVDPIRVAISFRLISESAVKRLSPTELQNKRKQLFSIKQVKNSIINERSRTLNACAKLFLQSMQAMIQALPFGVKWILTSLYNRVQGLILNFKGQIPGCPEEASATARDVALLIGIFVLRTCVLPAIHDCYDFGLLLPSTKTKSVFSQNCKALGVILLDVLSFDGVKEGQWYDGIRTSCNSLQDTIVSAVSTIVSSTQLKTIQNKLEMDLYRERIREDDLLYTVNVGTLYYLRWVVSRAGTNSLFEADSFKYARLAKQSSRENFANHSLNTVEAQQHDDPVKHLISSSIWGEEGITSVDGFETENASYAAEGGVIPKSERNLALNISIPTRWFSQNENFRRCGTCGATLPSKLAPANASPIRSDEQYAVEILSHLNPAKTSFRNMLRQGRVPEEINANKSRDVLNAYIEYLNSQFKKACTQSLYGDMREIKSVLDLMHTFVESPAKVSQVMSEMILELNARRLAYEKIYTYQSEIKKLELEISKFCVLKHESVRAYKEYLQSLKNGQSEQQNRMVVSMDAREQMKKCNLLCFSCCATGELTNPHLVEEINSAARPDKNAKQLGLRSMVCNVTMTYSYRRLRKRSVIHVYRLGMIEDNTGSSDKSESDGIVSPDSICHYEVSEDITKAEYSQYHGRLLKGINRSKLKSKLVYKFSQESSSKYTVYVIYDKNIVLEQFSLYMNTMAELSRRGVILYTPDGSNTTFVAPKLLKILSEVQMKNILIG